MYFATLAERVKFLSRYSMLVVDEIGYLPVGSGGGNLFFQLVNACYERCPMIMTGNRGIGEWADIFGDAVVIPIEGNSYRLREHAALIPEHLRGRPLMPDAAPTLHITRRPGRPRKEADGSTPG